MPSLYETLRADIIVAMKAHDSATTLALRTADAGIKRAAMDSNKEIDDALTIATLRKAVGILNEQAAWIPLLRPLNIEAMRKTIDYTPRGDGYVLAADVTPVQ